MNMNNPDKFIRDNRGESLVEVMVAFIVLMIVVAMFTGATRAAGAAVTNSIDLRRTYDSEYENYRKELGKKYRDASYVSSMETGSTKDIPVTLTDGTTLNLTAYQYRSGNSVYWVFR